MKTGKLKILGMIILGLAYIWLAWGVLSSPNGFNLMNILIVVMAGIIIFVPLFKKLNREK